MKSSHRHPLFAFCALVGTLFLAACGSGAPAVDSYNEFRDYVQAGNFAQAHAMLTDESKARIKDTEALKALCTADYNKAFFEPSAKLQNPTFEGGNKSITLGSIHMFDKDGKKLLGEGQWKAREVGGKWRVEWMLSTAPPAVDPTR